MMPDVGWSGSPAWPTLVLTFVGQEGQEDGGDSAPYLLTEPCVPFPPVRPL